MLHSTAAFDILCLVLGLDLEQQDQQNLRHSKEYKRPSAKTQRAKIASQGPERESRTLPPVRGCVRLWRRGALGGLWGYCELCGGLFRRKLTGRFSKVSPVGKDVTRQHGEQP